MRSPCVPPRLGSSSPPPGAGTPPDRICTIMGRRKKPEPAARKSAPGRAKKPAKKPPEAVAVPEAPPVSLPPPPPEPPRPTSTGDPRCQPWIDYVCTHGGGFAAQSPATPGRAESNLTITPERIVPHAEFET